MSRRSSTLISRSGTARPPSGTPLIDMERYKGNVDTLKIVDNDIRYKADSFVFNVAGAPEEVKQFSGISRPESWGGGPMLSWAAT